MEILKIIKLKLGEKYTFNVFFSSKQILEVSAETLLNISLFRLTVLESLGIFVTYSGEQWFNILRRHLNGEEYYE